MFDSKKYWNDRYLKGETSGAGSYNHLAQFKGNVINNFIGKNQIKSIVDYGVGDGNQLKLINTENLIYTGIDVSEIIISKCKEEFKEDKTKKFIHTDNIDDELKAKLVLSCDVIYHLIEEHVYKEYMENLFSMSKKYVIIYAKNEDINHAIHVKYRKFSNYIESNLPEWQLIKHIPNKFPQLTLGQNNDNTSPSDFYIYEKDAKINSFSSSSAIPILICGFPHCGTSILKSIIGHIEDVEEIIIETDYISADILNNSKHKFVLAKTPYFKDDILTKKYDDYIKIIIARNPCYVYSSLNKRYNYNIPVKLGLGNLYLKSLEKIDYLINEKRENLYTIFYEDLFNNNYEKLRDILDRVGLKYTDDIFNNNLYENFSNGPKVIPKVHPLRTDHDNFRTWQINQPFENMNNPAKIDLTEKQKKFIVSNPLINKYFDTSIISPVYISLTSIFNNQDILLQTLQSIMKQTRLPDKIFLYLSEEPYLLDDGFKDKKITNSELFKYINDNSIIDIKWVKNIGPYRKLLPLLKDKWDEDCIIITIDDDTIYDTNLIEKLVNDYHKHECVIGYRGFTPLFDKLDNFEYSKRDEIQDLSLHNFFTGKGGILYKPQFFHKTHDLIFNDKIYLNTCPTCDDIWFYIVRLLNNVKGYLGNKNWQIKDLIRDGLYVKFNRENNMNTNSFKKTFEKLKELGYKFS